MKRQTHGTTRVTPIETGLRSCLKTQKVPEQAHLYPRKGTELSSQTGKEIG